MEEKNRAKDGPLLTLDPCISNLEDPSISSPLSKPIRRLKRDALKEKKKAKAAESKVVQSEELETDNVSSKPKQDEVGSVTSKDSCDGSDKLVRQRAEIATALIPKLIIKPPYVALASSNQIVGSFGHASAIFKKPIIQGHYFMEFTIKQDSKKEKPTTYPSAVRVGACIHSFDTAYPLGCNQSIGYKSSDGSIVRQNEVIGKAEPYSVGDVIGICLRIRPRRKHENEKEVDLGSKAQFYKNGKLVFEYKQLRQVFYCFGISVYNYSQVKIEDCQEGLFKIEGASHYLTSLQEKIPYRDLLGNKLFKV